MAIQITTTDLIKEYFNGVLDRSKCHANDVKEVCLPIMGAVIWRSEGDIEVKETKDGGMGNILWFRTSDGSRYSLYYNHKNLKIELRAKNFKGEILHSFNNSNTQAEVFNIFNDL
jgi:hypothetical protein